MYQASVVCEDEKRNNGTVKPIDEEVLSETDEEEEEDDEFDEYGECTSSSESEVEKYEQCDCVDDKTKKEEKIPYTTVYSSNDEFERRGYLIPGKPVKATILSVEREESSLFNSYVWHVKRRYKDFQHLHNRLLMFRTAQQVKAPMRRLRHRRMAIRFDRTLPYDDGTDGLTEGVIKYDDDDSALGKVNQGLDVSELADVESKASPKGPTVVIPMTRRETARNRSKIQPHHTDTPGAIVEPAGQQPSMISTGQLDNVPAVINGGNGRRKRKRHHHHVHKLPNFPFVPDSMIGSENIDVRKDELQHYISKILHIPAYRNHSETALFMDVSKLSFVNNLGSKLKEGLVKKRPGGRRQFHGVSRFCVERCAKWSKRWLVVKDNFIAYIHPRTNLIRFVMLFDSDFQVKVGGQHLEGIKCELLLRVESDQQAIEWKESIDNATTNRGRIWLDTHQFGSTFPVRDHAYAHWFVDGRRYMEHVANMLELAKEEILITDWWLSPEVYLKRPMVEGNRWRLDEVLKRKASHGVRVFILLYKEVEMALGIKSGYSKQILSKMHPNIKVLRHPDHVPGPTATVLWAHHEKMVIIDQNIAFIGGIDLCYGRWDDHCHRLVDTGSIQYTSKPSLANLAGKGLFSGMKAMAQFIPVLTLAEGDVTTTDAATATAGENADVFYTATSTATTAAGAADAEAMAASVEKDTLQFTKPEVRLREKSLTPSRLPPLPQSTSNRLSTESTESVSAKPKGWARVRRLMSAPTEQSVLANLSPKRKSDDPKSTMEEIQKEFRIKRLMSTPGNRMDMADVVKKYKEFVESGQVEKVKRSGTPPIQRKPNKMIKVLTDWKRRLKHREEVDSGLAAEYEEMWSQLQEEAQADFGLAGAGKMWMGKDYVNFIFKDFTDLEMPYHDFIDRAVTPRMPWHDIGSVVYGSAARDAARHFIQRWNMCKVEKVKYDDSYPYILPKSYENVQVPKVFRQISHRCRVQILRSGAGWSCGVNHTEDSIHEAYIHMISTAKHYIYIENQFFISLVDSPEVHNRICKALCDRIVKAHKQNETFRVYILLPLLPGFEGQLGTTGGSALQAVLYWTYKSISKGPHSLVGYLSKEIDNYGQYLTFCSLRTHGVLCDRLITELIYIHSKLIIVDDKFCLIGSANINDRSQLGKRDSEVAIFVEDTEFEPSKMNGQSYKSGRFSGSIRRHLFREHLGLLDKNGRPLKGTKFDVSDPVSDSFWTRFKDVARKNTHIYENVFRCFPTDEVKSFEQLENYKTQISLADFNRAAAEEQLSHLQGYLVQFPISFLYNSDLAPSLKTKEGLAPISLFT